MVHFPASYVSLPECIYMFLFLRFTFIHYPFFGNQSWQRLNPVCEFEYISQKEIIGILQPAMLLWQ